RRRHPNMWWQAQLGGCTRIGFPQKSRASSADTLARSGLRAAEDYPDIRRLRESNRRLTPWGF
ncbi:MAG: hypothetical protein QME96_18210, partial [Myxococcota bacterium]|nr:hypothetical protein [Myxococcota bacterium]